MLNNPFYGTSGPRDADIMIVGESWGSEEYQQHLPFVGSSGNDLTLMLAKGGIDRDKCFITNVAPDQPFDNNMVNFFNLPDEAPVEFQHLHPKQIVLDGIANVQRQIELVKPKIIITCGNYATWALAPSVPIYRKKEKKVIPTGIMNTPRQGFRGSQYYTETTADPIPLLPVLHPAAIQRVWKFFNTTVHDFKCRVPKALNNQWDDIPRQFLINPSFEQAAIELGRIADRIMKEPTLLSLDLETYKGHITCIGLATEIDHAICLPLVQLAEKKLIPYWTEYEHCFLLEQLRRILAHPNCRLVGQNFLYDIQYLWRWLHVIPAVEFDTMIAQHVCFPTLPKDLNYISSMYCTFHRFWKGEGKEWDKRTELDTLWRYNCRDVVATLEAARELKDVIKSYGLEEQFQFQMRQFQLAFNLMTRGVRTDEKKIHDMKLKLDEKLYEIETWLEKIVPEEILPRKKKAAAWYNSDKQTNNFLYEVLGLKKQYHKKTGALSVNKEALQELGNAYPFIRPVTEALVLLRTTSTFITNFLSAERDPDKRMRCSYNVGGTYTFRLSSSENAFGRGTNLQNIPKNQED